MKNNFYTIIGLFVLLSIIVYSNREKFSTSKPTNKFKTPKFTTHKPTHKPKTHKPTIHKPKTHKPKTHKPVK